jgi:hypothetical protein
MSGAVGIFEPRGVPGLELGVARFFHSVWPRNGIPRSYFSKPFEAILKNSLGSSAGFVGETAVGVGDNQLASVFVRWVFPSAGFEVYSEYGREDHNADQRDLLQEPDHSRSYGLGLRKVIRADSLRLSALRIELINYELPTLARHRGEGGTYIHSELRQGHTNMGQVLGADVGVGTGAGSIFAWDTYDRQGKFTIGWTRSVQQQNGSYYLGNADNARANDVSHTVEFDRLSYFRFGEIRGGLGLVREFNRGFQRDEWNVNSTLALSHYF